MRTAGDSSKAGPPYRSGVRRVVERHRGIVGLPGKEALTAGFRGWHERGYLPHRDEPGLTQFVTFRLAESFPAELRRQWERLLKIEDDRQRRMELEAWLDLGKGVCWLKDERVATVVAEALRHFDGERYRLLAWVIMPNHVHVLVKTDQEPLSKVVRTWKQFSARKANAILGRSGAFWQADYWDTFMRDRDHEQNTIRYIQENPVKAGLVKTFRGWRWGSWNFEANE